jgi:Tfp pilus assembly protein PilO
MHTKTTLRFALVVNQVILISATLAAVVWGFNLYVFPQSIKAFSSYRESAVIRDFINSQEKKWKFNHQIRVFRSSLQKKLSRSQVKKSRSIFRVYFQKLYDAQWSASRDINIRKIRPDEVALRSGALKIRILLEIECSYSALYQFVKYLEGIPRVFSIQGMSISRKVNRLQVNMVITGSLKTK